MLLFIVLLGALSLFLFGLVAYRAFTKDKEIIAERMNRYVEQRQQPISTRLQTAGIEGTEKRVASYRLLIREMSKYLESPKLSQYMEHKLIQAGLPMRAAEFMVICLATSLFGLLLMALLSGGKFFFLLFGLILGYLIPHIFLRIKIEKRAKAFNDQLGDTLVLVANSLRTGYSFLQAVEMVSREMLPPISEEFGRVLKEMNLGVGTEEAMNNLAKRVNSDDLDLVVTAVLIQRQVGGNLAEVLDNIANTIRERVKIKGQIKTLTAQGRISGMIISFLPVGVGAMIYFMNPDYISLLFTHSLGRAMLAGGVVSQLIGILLIRKIVNIDV